MQFATDIGFLPELIGAAAGALTKSGQPPAGVRSPAGSGLPGTEASVPRQPGAVTSVSPAIQTQISPQISPTMVQQQSSPGATVGASPTQYMPGGMGAETGVSPYGGYAAPGYPGTSPGISPLQPYGGQPGGPYYPVSGPLPGMPSTIRQGPTGLPQWVIPAAIVGGGVLLAIVMRRRGKRTTR